MFFYQVDIITLLVSLKRTPFTWDQVLLKIKFQYGAITFSRSLDNQVVKDD